MKKNVNQKEMIILAVDVLNDELIGMTEEQIMQIVAFARFLKYNSQTRNDAAKASSKGHKRTPGGMPGKLWMADDFDEIPDCFSEYV